MIVCLQWYSSSPDQATIGFRVILNATELNLTTDDDCTQYQTSATHYQLAPSVLQKGRIGLGKWVSLGMKCCAHGGCFGWP